MALTTLKGTLTVVACADTDKHIVKIKEELLKPAQTDTCTPETPVAGKIRYFKPEIETNILKGDPSSSGEIPKAIADEQVQINIYHHQVEEQNNTALLLCGALDTAEAYTAVSNCLALTLVSESNDLPKLLGEMSKITADSAKEFPAIAEKIKKSYDQICAVKTAFNAMKQCVDKVCNADEKKLLKDELASLGDMEKEVDILVAQGEEAVMSVVQAASIFALNNVSGLETLVGSVKPQAEQFKKDTDGNIDAAAKKATEWQKKYNEAAVAVAVAHGEYGKAATLKYGKEAAYCFMNQSKAERLSQKDNLLKLLEEAKKKPQ